MQPQWNGFDPDAAVELHMLDDLNGDGRHDFLLTYRAVPHGAPWTAMAFHVVATHDKDCYRRVYGGEGIASVDAQSMSVRGWRRLRLSTQFGVDFSEVTDSVVLLEFEPEAASYTCVVVEACTTNGQPCADPSAITACAAVP